MVSGEDALNLLDQISHMIVFKDKKEEKEITESFIRMRNRFAYHIDQAAPVELKYHKGKYGSKYDSWTCRNCGCGITHGVVQNFCWNCGHRLAWDPLNKININLRAEAVCCFRPLFSSPITLQAKSKIPEKISNYVAYYLQNGIIIILTLIFIYPLFKPYLRLFLL